jgi:hypothetical protein
MGIAKLRYLALVAAGLFGLGLEGCNGGAAQLLGCPSTKVSNNGVPQLLFPESGATKVPDSAAAIVIAFNGTASEVDTLDLVDSKTSVAIGPVKAAPSPRPSPMASPPAGWSIYSVPLPPLSARMQYTLKYTYTASYNSCNGQQTATSTVGQFTTQ